MASLVKLSRVLFAASEIENGGIPTYRPKHNSDTFYITSFAAGLRLYRTNIYDVEEY